MDRIQGYIDGLLKARAIITDAWMNAGYVSNEARDWLLIRLDAEIRAHAED